MNTKNGFPVLNVVIDILQCVVLFPLKLVNGLICHHVRKGHVFWFCMLGRTPAICLLPFFVMALSHPRKSLKMSSVVFCYAFSVFSGRFLNGVLPSGVM